MLFKIIFRSQIFDIDKKIAEELRKTNKGDLIEYYQKYFISSSRDCRRVKINTVACGKRMNDESEEDISDLKEKYNFYKC
jgi:hypothetical protein